MSLHNVVKAVTVIIIIVTVVVVVLYNIKIIHTINFQAGITKYITCNGKITILVSQCHNKFPLNVSIL